jgi:hypothetical protein
MNFEPYKASFSVEFSQALNCHATCMIKVISEVLGHASVAFTMDTYSHIISGMLGDMTALLDEVLPLGMLGTLRRGSPRLQCQRSSGVEQRFRKPPVVGSNPTAGWG